MTTTRSGDAAPAAGARRFVAPAAGEDASDPWLHAGPRAVSDGAVCDENGRCDREVWVPRYEKLCDREFSVMCDSSVAEAKGAAATPLYAVMTRRPLPAAATPVYAVMMRRPCPSAAVPDALAYIVGLTFSAIETERPVQRIAIWAQV
eukprot:CAMPEP_0118892820 /NCGR_PEP_ID=MMETSP1166-20130328/2274_1 /TAXON_ID=1104430 /ORGANISM="Chrysoreinhardia sp, Strain CCMP3193" /LENGTH=147 /DNA_ID=CAMNT_0006831579 /DNA_START=359 /DNA_END=802 /DNA_ORIENTATION=-